MTRARLIIILTAGFAVPFLCVAPARCQTDMSPAAPVEAPQEAPAAPLTGVPPGALATPTPNAELGKSANPVRPGGEIYQPGANYAGYVLGPGDSLSVTVMPQTKYSVANLPILQDGSLYFPEIGRINATGMTVDQLTEAITAGLSKYCVNPNVTVTLTALRQQVVYVTGGVENPQVLDANAASTLAKAITLCGGPKDDNMLAHVTVLRGDQVLTANVYELLVHGSDNGQDLRLLSGDLVIVPLNTERVTVLGEVNRPGQYGLEQSGVSAEGPERLADAIIMAGGVQGSAAKIRSVGVLRRVADAAQPKLYTYNYGKYLKEGDESQNPVMQDNDVVIVPPSQRSAISPGSIFSYLPFYALFRQILP